MSSSIVRSRCAATIAALTFIVQAAPGGAQGAGASPQPTPEVTVVTGFNNTVYEVTAPMPPPTPKDQYPSNICGAQYGGAPTTTRPAAPTPDPYATAAPFTSGMWLIPAPTSAAPVCPAADLVATQHGLSIEFVARVPITESTAAPVVRLDNVDFAADPYVKVLICKGSCPSNDSRSGDVVLEYHVNGANNVYTLQHGRLAPPAAAMAVALATVAASPAPSSTGWSGIITVPWSAMELPADASVVVAVRLSIVRPNVQPEKIGEQTITIRSRPAFRGITTTVSHVDNDHRWAALTQYDQFVSPSTTPPPTAVGPNGTTLTLLNPATPKSTNRFPLTGDVSAPITNQVAFSGTVAQNASVVQGVQTAINAQVGAAVLPTPSPLPSVPCGTCGTFQSANAPMFSLPIGSAHLLLPNKALGSDDSPFALAALGDLRAGGALLYGKGDTSLGLLQTQIVNDTTQLASSDSALGYQVRRGQATLSGLAIFANHQQAAATVPAPGAPPTPPGNVTIPHLATYAFALVNDHVSSSKGCGMTRDDRRDQTACGQGASAPSAVLSDVTQFARAAYDVTDGAANAFGGVQDKRTIIGGSGAQFARTLMLGYRATGRNYQQIDGTQTALPTVGGPVASLELSTQPANRTLPMFDLVASAHRYYSRADQARWQDAKLSFNFTDSVGLFYEIQGSRVTAPLAAVNKLGGQLGDAPYQGAVNQLDPKALPVLLSSHDQSVGFNYGKTTEGSQLTFTFGYGFDHAEPVCVMAPPPVSATPLSAPMIIRCSQGVPTKSYTLGGSIVANNVTLAASWVPTYYREARSSSPPSERVYNLVFGYKLNPCDGILVTATNDAGVLSLSSIGRLQSAFQAELDIQRGFGLYRTNALLPTLFVGMQNKFGFVQTAYTNTVVPPAVTSIFPAALATHQVTLYTGVRFGNRAFRASAGNDQTCAPPPKAALGMPGS